MTLKWVKKGRFHIDGREYQTVIPFTGPLICYRLWLRWKKLAPGRKYPYLLTEAEKATYFQPKPQSLADIPDAMWLEAHRKLLTAPVLGLRTVEQREDYLRHQ